MPGLPEPVKVSPLIKFLRYSFLIAGIIYGASKLKAFRIIEEGRKDEKERKKLEREMRIAAEKKAASERDIAQIVAIFTGKPETEPKLADQSYSPEPAKLSTEEVKHIVDDEKSFSDNLSTCTVEEVKQIVESDNTYHSSTVRTEYGSIEQDGSTASSPDKSSAYIPDNDHSDMFSDVINLTPPKARRNDSEKAKIISEPSDSGTNQNVVEQPNKQDGYYVEDFADRATYSQPKAFKEDFFGKDDK